MDEYCPECGKRIIPKFKHVCYIYDLSDGQPADAAISNTPSLLELLCEINQPYNPITDIMFNGRLNGEPIKVPADLSALFKGADEPFRI